MSIDTKVFENFINVFKKSFEEVTEELVESKYVPVSETINDTSKVVIIIGISGKSKGRILLESSYQTALDFAVAMNCGDAFDDNKEMYLYIAEFSNMFCGRATTYVNNEYHERTFWLAPPAIFSADNLQIESPSIKSEKVYYKGEQGIFLVDIGIEENE